MGITQYDQGDDDDMMIMYYNNEADSYQPDDDVKQKMSVVLSELKSVVQTKQDIPMASNSKKRGNAYEKFAHVTDVSWQQQPQQPMLKPTQRNDDDFGNDFMGELNKFEFEINNERQRRHSQHQHQQQHLHQQTGGQSSANRSGYSHQSANQSQRPRNGKRKKRRKRSSGAVGGNGAAKEYDSDEQVDRYSTSPYSSSDDVNAAAALATGHRSDSSGATSGPDSPCRFIDTEDATVAGEYNTNTSANSKNGDFVEATNNLDTETRQQQTQQHFQFNEQSHEMISAAITNNNMSNNGGRIGDDVHASMGDDTYVDAQKQLNTVPNEFEFESDRKHNIERSGGEMSTESNETAVADLSMVSGRSASLETNPDSITTTTASDVAQIKSKSSKLGKMLSHESSQDSTNGGLGSSKWKLLKTLKEKKIEEKNNQEKIKEEENANKEKDSVSISAYCCAAFECDEVFASVVVVVEAICK